MQRLPRLETIRLDARVNLHVRIVLAVVGVPCAPDMERSHDCCSCKEEPEIRVSKCPVNKTYSLAEHTTRKPQILSPPWPRGRDPNDNSALP
jgi:hypothetical protein